MRSVTFVDRLTLDICGEVAQHGVCLADVTGDGDSELVVATDIGDLYIYKYGEPGLSRAPFRPTLCCRKLKAESIVTVLSQHILGFQES